MPFPTSSDQLMYAFVQLALDPLEILRRYWPTMRPYYDNDLPRFCRRRPQVRPDSSASPSGSANDLAISFRVTAFDLDPKTGFRFPPVQSPLHRRVGRDGIAMFQGVLEEES